MPYRPRRPSPPWDHPRVCGEKARTERLAVAGVGSPPRVRGKVPVGGQDFAILRITPACAGKRPRPSDCTRRCRDHPRVCGEKLDKIGSFMGLLGSPPRVRGKGEPECFVAAVVGITPACAGKSETFVVREVSTGDHPRVCGEKSVCETGAALFLGSPPRVRGKARRDAR